VTFESGCRLERIDKWMFDNSRVSFDSIFREFTRGKENGKPESK
jgi:hypothetical protein